MPLFDLGTTDDAAVPHRTVLAVAQGSETRQRPARPGHLRQSTSRSVGNAAPAGSLGTSSDSSALTSTDSSLRDRALVSPITAAVLLLEQSGHRGAVTPSGVKEPSRRRGPRYRSGLDASVSRGFEDSCLPPRTRRSNYIAGADLGRRTGRLPGCQFRASAASWPAPFSCQWWPDRPRRGAPVAELKEPIDRSSPVAAFTQRPATSLALDAENRLPLRASERRKQKRWIDGRSGDDAEVS